MTKEPKESIFRRLANALLNAGSIGELDEASQEESAAKIRTKIFLISFTILFFELICIRWIPAYVRFLGYFSNFILLASFLGTGLGILSSRQKNFRFIAFPALIVILLVTVLSNRFEFTINSTQILYFAQTEQAKAKEHIWILPIIFTLVAIAFLPLGRALGRLLPKLPPLQAYTFDILGSLAGIITFSLLAFLSTPPVVWFIILSLVVLGLMTKSDRKKALPWLIFSCLIVLGYGSHSYWSPYYRIQTTPNTLGGYVINVNNTGHQETMPYEYKENIYFNAYDLLGAKPFDEVLVLGAGSGSDVAIALHNGAKHIDAVEIDPKILKLGTTLNPDQPYANPRVTTHVNDGRSFLRQTDKKYDLIIFALPDSLTLTSGFASLRLESFLLTTEAIAEAKNHLTDTGLVVLYNYYREDWLVQKLAGMVNQAFGTPPFVTTYGTWGRAAVILAGPRLTDLNPNFERIYSKEQIAPDFTKPHLFDLEISGYGRMTGDPGQKLASDNWPFVYLPIATIPTIFLEGLLMILVIGLGLLVLVAPKGLARQFNWHFFSLGAAFMLLETRSLVLFSLLFGSTWIVNALVFLAILLSVLASIIVTSRWTIRRTLPLYLLLAGFLLLNFVLKPDQFLAIESTGLRYTLISLLAFIPIFLANIVFSQAFRTSIEADIAFASNLLGIVLGGILEYTALAFGYQALVIGAIIFYGVAFAFRQPKQSLIS